ncbi:MAG: hypothetical protein WDZ35_13415 [Crocinitomicaceae bacterium]
MAIKKNNFQDYIGRIVCLKSHYSNSISDIIDINFVGDPNYNSPLMVISELIVLETVEPDKSDLGSKSLPLEQTKCKCIWFSTKQMQFVDTWIYGKHLNLFKDEEKANELPKVNELQVNSKVIFKTSPVELFKRKTYMQFSEGKKDRKAVSFLDFTSPLLIAIDIVDYKMKNNHQEKELWHSAKQVKCKYYKNNSDKFSEVHLPIESLILVPEVKQSRMKRLKRLMNNSKEIIISSDKNKELMCGNVLNLNTAGGSVYIDFFNQISQETHVIDMSRINKISSLKRREQNSLYPEYSIGSDKTLKIKTAEDYLDSGFKNEDEVVLKIIYKNMYDQLTTRFIYPISVQRIKLDKKKGGKKKESELYLEAFCFLREEKRFFKAERIQNLEVYNNKKLITYLKKLK